MKKKVPKNPYFQSLSTGLLFIKNFIIGSYSIKKNKKAKN